MASEEQSIRAWNNAGRSREEATSERKRVEHANFALPSLSPTRTKVCTIGLPCCSPFPSHLPPPPHPRWCVPQDWQWRCRCW